MLCCVCLSVCVRACVHVCGMCVWCVVCGVACVQCVAWRGVVWFVTTCVTIPHSPGTLPMIRVTCTHQNCVVQHHELLPGAEEEDVDNWVH